MVITSKNEKENYSYLAMFNKSDEKNQYVEVKLETLGFNGNVKITNIWTSKFLGVFKNTFAQNLVPHPSGLILIEEK